MILSTACLALLLLSAGGSPAAAADASGSASVTIVVDDGGTKVHNKGATWVSVTPNAEGKTQVLSPGSRGEYSASAPDVSGPGPAVNGAAARNLTAPSLLAPRDGEQVKVMTSAEHGPAQVVLSWTPVAGAREYAVEFTVDNGKPILLRTSRAEAKLPPIQGGKVAWAVRTLGDGSTSEPSGKRWFQLQAEPLKVEAKAGGWK